jgi:hypothetical protein
LSVGIAASSLRDNVVSMEVSFVRIRGQRDRICVHRTDGSEVSWVFPTYGDELLRRLREAWRAIEAKGTIRLRFDARDLEQSFAEIASGEVS